jgi:hypothetical protein
MRLPDPAVHRRAVPVLPTMALFCRLAVAAGSVRAQQPAVEVP